MCEDFPDGRMVTMTAGGAKSGDTSEDVAEKIAHSVAAMHIENAECAGVTSDSGGGGSVESGATATGKATSCADALLVANCCLHNINLETGVPMKKLLM